MKSKIIYKRGDIITDFGNDNKAMIMQQNNCTATKINKRSFAYSLFKNLQFSDPYRYRRSTPHYNNLSIIKDRPIPGTIKLMHLDDNHPIVCCLFAQYRMGTPDCLYYKNKRYTDDEYNNYIDDSNARLNYFKECLEHVLELFNNDDNNDNDNNNSSSSNSNNNNNNNNNNNKSIIKNINKIIFPKNIGCNLAGGNWQLYRKEIKVFARKLRKINNSINIYIISYMYSQ